MAVWQFPYSSISHFYNGVIKKRKSSNVWQFPYSGISLSTIGIGVVVPLLWVVRQFPYSSISRFYLSTYHWYKTLTKDVAIPLFGYLSFLLELFKKYGVTNYVAIIPLFGWLSFLHWDNLRKKEKYLCGNSLKWVTLISTSEGIPYMHPMFLCQFPYSGISHFYEEPIMVKTTNTKQCQFP